MARRDWYLRESLRAIRDWEAILAEWEQATPEEQRTPALPVPTDGEAVEWPNPIPLRLLPDEDHGRRVHARLAESKVEITRLNANGTSAEELVDGGTAVLGYKHPGGGGRDHWYHGYHRRFDRLTAFVPQPAPFALRLGAPCDFRRGPNVLPFSVRNVTQKPLALTVGLSSWSPDERRTWGEQAVELAGGATQALEFGFDLDRQGGSLLVLSIEEAGRRFWLPLLTHVVDVDAVLENVAQILADTPDGTAADRLEALQRRQREWTASGESAAWGELFEDASALRDELLLRRLDFDTLLFVKRKPFDSEQPFMDAHHLRNRPGGGIYRLSPPGPAGSLEPLVESLREGVYRDVCLHWDATKLLFSFGNGNDDWDGGQSYHVYEVNANGEGLRQLTFGSKNDCESFYLPNGQIGFTSDRSEHFVMCGGDRHAPTLFVMEADGSGVRQLSFNCFNDFNPAVLPDGRIIYSRWEYNERSVTSLHKPFTMNPDGTMVEPYYGNATVRPNVVMFPRPVPGSHKIMGLFTAHHGQTHGPIGLIDQRRGVDGPEPIQVLTPNVPITGEKAEESYYGWYSDPWPLSESTYLCSFTPTALPWLEESWALYVGDDHGNLALVYRDPEISCAEPVPLVRRTRPPAMLPAAVGTDTEDALAELLLLDVHVGLAGVDRGQARHLRIVEDVPRKGVHWGGVVCTAASGIYTIKRIFGTVPIEPDGSAYFSVPANRNVYFEVLDEKQREIQRMRSVLCLKPGEQRTCIGCHEPRNTAPPNATALALHRAPSTPSLPPWGIETLSFLRDVQPVLNAKCIQCHTHDRYSNGVILTDDLTNQFTIGYEELLPYLAMANAMRWDHPDDVDARPPYTYGSGASRVCQLLDSGHHGVQLTDEDWQRLINWIDANGVYYDRYETSHYPNRRIFGDARRQPMVEVYRRRCADCHGDDDGRRDNWWLSLNRRDARLSRALQAPLAREAGGWGRCEETVFADTGDPDYQALLTSLRALAGELVEYPREDLLSLRGSEAEKQVVALPPPPPPGRRLEPSLPPGDWVYLSDLEWESGEAGWTPNGDDLPRLDRDVEGKPLRLGGRKLRKGLGTHAPSEIIYRLDGRYVRFFALVGGAEANGTVVFQVFGDDRLLHETDTMHGLGEAEEIDLPVEAVERLRLVVTDAGDGYTADMANWGRARLLRPPTVGL